MAFMGYCLMAMLRKRLEAHAPGLTPKAVLEQLASIQMVDAWLPTTDGRWLVIAAIYRTDGRSAGSAGEPEATAAKATTAPDPQRGAGGRLRPDLWCRPFDQFPQLRAVVAVGDGELRRLG